MPTPPGTEARPPTLCCHQWARGTPTYSLLSPASLRANRCLSSAIARTNDACPCFWKTWRMYTGIILGLSVEGFRPFTLERSWRSLRRNEARHFDQMRHCPGLVA
jgi:hypothetical protein